MNIAKASKSKGLEAKWPWVQKNAFRFNFRGLISARLLSLFDANSGFPMTDGLLSRIKGRGHFTPDGESHLVPL